MYRRIHLFSTFVLLAVSLGLMAASCDAGDAGDGGPADPTSSGSADDPAAEPTGFAIADDAAADPGLGGDADSADTGSDDVALPGDPPAECDDATTGDDHATTDDRGATTDDPAASTDASDAGGATDEPTDPTPEDDGAATDEPTDPIPEDDGDTTDEPAPVSLGDCDNGPDLDALDAAQDSMSDTMGSCAIECLLTGGSCAAECSATKLGISAACGACFGEMILCTTSSCALVCLDATSEACTTCQVNSCFPEFETCAGIDVPGA